MTPPTGVAGGGMDELTVIRKRSSDFTTDPSNTACTRNARAICATGSPVPLNRIAEVRETTRKVAILANSVMRASVTPSAKYSCEGSPLRLAKGNTAIDSKRQGTSIRRTESVKRYPR